MTSSINSNRGILAEVVEKSKTLAQTLADKKDELEKLQIEKDELMKEVDEKTRYCNGLTSKDAGKKTLRNRNMTFGLFLGAVYMFMLYYLIVGDLVYLSNKSND